MSLRDSISQSKAWRHGEPIDEPVTEDMISQAKLGDGLLVWVDLENPSEADLNELGKRLDLPAPTLEDVTAKNERPKLSQHSQYYFLTLYGTERMPPHQDPESTESRLKLYQMSAIATPSALVTIRTRPDIDLKPLLHRWADTADVIGSGGVGALAHGLLDYNIDSFTAAIQSIDDDLDELEGVLFGEKPPGRSFLTKIYIARKDLRHLRRIALPMRDVVNEVVRRRKRDGTDLDQWYDDLVDHSARVVDWSEALRDSMGTMFETSLSLQDSRLNMIMKKLAGWAAIIALPTAITGWFGQNVPYFGFNKAFGVWISVALIVVSTVTLYIQFKARDWL